VLVAPSPSGTYLARVVTVAAPAAPAHPASAEGLFPAPTVAASTSQTSRVDIFTRGQLLVSLPLPSAAYTDGLFEGCAWSPDEQSIVIVAEASHEPADEGSTSVREPLVDDVHARKYEYKPDWGEAMVGRRRPALLLLSLSRRTVVELAPGAVGLAAGAPAWGPGGASSRRW
jgi:hypothetical protein